MNSNDAIRKNLGRVWLNGLNVHQGLCPDSIFMLILGAGCEQFYH